jgi:O-antigen/teichoic acid export membrane protein
MSLLALPRRTLAAVFGGPVVAIFVSANLVNFGNLGFNVLFSRWMGPVLFGQLATLLTLFLAVMGVLGALQLAVSQQVAGARDQSGTLTAGLARFARNGFVAGLVALPVLIAACLALNLGSALGLSSALLLPLLLLCLPFVLPLALARGIATGRLAARSVILSAQVEMWVRLIGAALAWQAGLGLPGVMAVIALSVVAGWLPLRSIFGRPALPVPAIAAGVVLAALPFAALQAGQVLLMDGDVLLAQGLLGPQDVGQLAALGLFQRIQFFGCFSLAAVLLPAVVTEVAAERSPLTAAIPVFALYVGVSGVLFGLACAFPTQVLTALVGPAFLPAAPLLPMISASAAAFTLSYLLATYLAAIGDRWGIFAITLACPLQLTAIALFTDSLGDLVAIKLSCQLVLATLLLFRAARRSFPAASTASLSTPA